MRNFTNILANNFGGISLQDIRKSGVINMSKAAAQRIFGQGVVYKSEDIGSMTLGFSVRYLGNNAKVFVSAK